MFYTIYKITNTVNGREYIGAHKTDDLNDRYMGSGKNIKHAIDFYGIGSFRKEILHVFDTEEEMYLKEAELVTDDYISLPYTYNIKPGGKGGTAYEQSEEHRKKNSDALKGRIITPVHRKRISEALKKYVRTEEHQQKINEMSKSVVCTPEHRERMSIQSKELFETRPGLKSKISTSLKSFYANETDEQRQIRILKHTGKSTSEETRQKISLAHKGKRVGDKNHMFGKPALNRRRVSGEGIVYDSVKEAAKSLGLSQGTIVARCKSDKNKVWFYVE